MACNHTGAANQKVKRSIIEEVCTGAGVELGEGKQTNGAAAAVAAAAAAAAALTHGPHSQPPPTSLCSSEKKAPFVSKSRGGGEGLRGEPPLSSATKKKRKGPDFPPLSSVVSTHSPLQHTNTGLISFASTAVVIVFSCNLIGSVCVAALKTSLTMSWLLMHGL